MTMAETREERALAVMGLRLSARGDMEAIRRAYRSLALKHHPDRSVALSGPAAPQPPKTTPSFQEIKEAYEFLKRKLPLKRMRRGDKGDDDDEDDDEYDRGEAKRMRASRLERGFGYFGRGSDKGRSEGLVVGAESSSSVVVGGDGDHLPEVRVASGPCHHFSDGVPMTMRSERRRRDVAVMEDASRFTRNMLHIEVRALLRHVYPDGVLHLRLPDIRDCHVCAASSAASPASDGGSNSKWKIPPCDRCNGAGMIQRIFREANGDISYEENTCPICLGSTSDSSHDDDRGCNGEGSGGGKEKKEECSECRARGFVFVDDNASPGSAHIVKLQIDVREGKAQHILKLVEFGGQQPRSILVHACVTLSDDPPFFFCDAPRGLVSLGEFLVSRDIDLFDNACTYDVECIVSFNNAGSGDSTTAIIRGRAEGEGEIELLLPTGYFHGGVHPPSAEGENTVIRYKIPEETLKAHREGEEEQERAGNAESLVCKHPFTRIEIPDQGLIAPAENSKGREQQRGSLIYRTNDCDGRGCLLCITTCRRRR